MSDLLRAAQQPLEQLCPLAKHTFVGSYQDHLATDERHKIKRPPLTFTVERACAECIVKQQLIDQLQLRIAELEVVRKP